MPKAKDLISDLKNLANQEKAQVLQRFFKTGKGQYGEGDIFWGITVPEQRKLAKKYLDLDLTEIKKLITNKVHEQRLTGLLVLTYQYEKAVLPKKETIFNFYLKNKQYVNNWDLVDVTTPKIVGDYLLNDKNQQSQVWPLIKSENIWDRRIAILSTFPFIKNKQFLPIIDLATKVLEDQHDLIHKASGWMLREMGKIDQQQLISFLDKNSKKMPRTMLRYSIEKLEPTLKKKYMTK